MSNLHKWDKFYSRLGGSEPYGDSVTYQMAAQFLIDCNTIEDWGCGKGWFRRFVSPGVDYIGLDGSWSKFADRVVDLETYNSEVEGVFMRHVLEHNYGWENILVNALESFTQRMALVLFTPWSTTGKVEEIAFNDDYDVPDLSFPEELIVDYVKPFKYMIHEVESPQTFYGQEKVIFIEK